MERASQSKAINDPRKWGIIGDARKKEMTADERERESGKKRGHEV